MTSWTYKQTEPTLWTVGHYDGDDRFQPESDHGTPDEAAARVRWLNGGCDCAKRLDEHQEQIEALIATTTTHTELLDRDGERLDAIEEQQAEAPTWDGDPDERPTTFPLR